MELENHELNGNSENGQHSEDHIITLSGMYQEYFLDYASYVILERAVPAAHDGLKPVQRRILHAMKEMDDGRFHKVANIIGQTMQYHPHGDAAIGDALVNLGQKNLLIECQGNWGDTRTGDRAAAPRYIEARLSKFALEVAFNKKTTNWQLTYDGRKKEPLILPMKFPLVLAQGVDGIAVGLSTKILPHNFKELIKASIDILNDKKVKIYPDFENGGEIDIENYNGGKRGGKVKVRAKIEQVDKKTLVVKELPYGVTTSSLCDSIIKANDKGKIKIKKVIDNTAQEVEVLIELANNVSPQLTIDALYAFTDCEVSISPNACVIIDEKPHFLTVEEILKICTFSTKNLLKWELQIALDELAEKWHFASLEKIFIENRIYREIEECETWEEVLETIDTALKPYVKMFKRAITTDDIVRLTEIKIKRISKYNAFKADELIAQLEKEIEEVNYNLEHLTDYTIQYYQNLLNKYGKGRERKTRIKSFEAIEITQVVANNCKLYVNKKEGFIGHGLKKQEYICDCSDIDDIIVFRKDGKYLVTRISDKAFVGKNIIHVAVWKKGDERTTYNAIYADGKSKKSYVKRFQVTAITRDREYGVITDHELSKLLYFTANPNGESEIVKIQLSPTCSAKIKTFEYDFADLAIKGRGSRGNQLTKYPIRKVTQVSMGKSTLGAIKIWMDDVSGRLNKAERGIYLGAFDTGDQILIIYNDGAYELQDIDLEITQRFEAKKIAEIIKFDPKLVISALYYEGERKTTYVKRFQIETSTTDTKFSFVGEHSSTKLFFVTTKPNPVIQYGVRFRNKTEKGTLNLADLIDIKGWKSIGNKVSEYKLKTVKLLDWDKKEDKANEKPKKDETLKVGDSVDFDVPKNGTLFD